MFVRLLAPRLVCDHAAFAKSMFATAAGLGVVFMALLAPAAQAASDGFEAQWAVSCADGKQQFGLDFVSASGDASEDDMVVSLTTPRSKLVKLPLKRALYHPRGSVSDVKNLCDLANDSMAGTVAFKIENNLVLLWLSEDNRPTPDVLTLVLLDLEQGQVIDVLETHAEIKDVDGTQRLAIRRQRDGYQVRLIREWMENTNTDAIETAIEDWMTVKIKNRKIQFLPPKP